MTEQEKQHGRSVWDLMRRISISDFKKIMATIEKAIIDNDPCMVVVAEKGETKICVSTRRIQDAWLMIEARQIARDARLAKDVLARAGVPKKVVERLDSLRVRDRCVEWGWGSISTTELCKLGKSCCFLVCAGVSVSVLTWREMHCTAAGKRVEENVMNAILFLLFVDHSSNAKDFVTLPGKQHQPRLVSNINPV